MKIITIKINLAIFFLLLSFCGIAQERAAEELWFDCVYSGYSESGKVALIEHFAQFEQQLIDKGLLKDSSGKSYKEMLVKLQDASVSENLDLPPFVEGIQRIEKEALNNDAISDCQRSIEESEAFEASAGKFKIAVGQLGLRGEMNVVNFFKTLDEHIAEEKFEYNFYKLMVYVGFEIDELRDGPKIEDSDYIPPPPPPIEPSTEFQVFNISPDNAKNYSNYVNYQIHLDDDQRIIVFGQELSLAELEEQLLKKLESYQDWSPVMVTADMEHKQASLDEVVAAIRTVYEQQWETIAQEEHGMSYSKLRESEQLHIADRYPGVLYVARVFE